MSEWTFLTNHAMVLSLLARYPHGTAIEVAQAVGIRERTARKIIADLETAGYLTKKGKAEGTNTQSISTCRSAPPRISVRRGWLSTTGTAFTHAQIAPIPNIGA